MMIPERKYFMLAFTSLLLWGMLCIAIVSKAQTTDSTIYWHSRYDSAAHKYIIARQCLFNIQDYLDKVHKNKNLNVYILGWSQRSLDDFYTATGSKRPVLVKPVHKHK
jgi:hypothetical protein